MSVPTLFASAGYLPGRFRRSTIPDKKPRRDKAYSSFAFHSIPLYVTNPTLGGGSGEGNRIFLQREYGGITLFCRLCTFLKHAVNPHSGSLQKCLIAGKETADS